MGYLQSLANTKRTNVMRDNSRQALRGLVRKGGMLAGCLQTRRTSNRMLLAVVCLGAVVGCAPPPSTDTTPTWHSQYGTAIRVPANWITAGFLGFDLPEGTAMRRSFGPDLDLQVDINYCDVESLSEIVEKMENVKKKYAGATIIESSFKGYDAVYFSWRGRTSEIGKTRMAQSQSMYILNFLIEGNWYMIMYGGHSDDFMHHLEQVFLSMGSLTPHEQLGWPPDRRPSEPELLFHAATAAANFGHFGAARSFVARALDQRPNQPALVAFELCSDNFEETGVLELSELPNWQDTD